MSTEEKLDRLYQRFLLFPEHQKKDEWISSVLRWEREDAETKEKVQDGVVRVTFSFSWKEKRFITAVGMIFNVPTPHAVIDEMVEWMEKAQKEFPQFSEEENDRVVQWFKENAE